MTEGKADSEGHGHTETVHKVVLCILVVQWIKTVSLNTTPYRKIVDSILIRWMKHEPH